MIKFSSVKGCSFLMNKPLNEMCLSPKKQISSKIALRSIIVNLSRSLSFQNALMMEKAAAVGKVKKYETKKTPIKVFSLWIPRSRLCFFASPNFFAINHFSAKIFYFLVEWCSIAEVNEASSETKCSEESQEEHFLLYQLVRWAQPGSLCFFWYHTTVQAEAQFLVPSFM